MTSAIGGVLVVLGLVGLSLALGPRTDEGGPVEPLDAEPEPSGVRAFRGLVVALSATAVVAGAVMFGSVVA